MALFNWFDGQSREMDFICSRAAELRARYGDEAERWCDSRLAEAREAIDRRAMKQLKKALKHVR
jgi:hypothetical protein